jgi:DNA-binding winged helix-turn-helix (wHTH) protein/Tol biopolymer transport system component
VQRASNSLNESPEGRLLALRFGPFELDVRSGELRRNGTTVRLQPQPLKVLLLLAGRPGDVVTREEIQSEIWPAGTFVDFEQSLNFCIRQIRAALRDDANAPRFIETLPRRGYRWVAGPVQPETAPAVVHEWPRALTGDPTPRPLDSSGATAPAAPVPAATRPSWPAFAVVALVAALGLGAITALALRERAQPAASAPNFQRVTFRRGAVNTARFGPDGQVVYSAAWEGGPRVLYVVGSNSRDSSALDIKDARVAAVSSTGDVAFLRARVLARAPLAGGPAKDMLSDVIHADWSADGKDLAIVRAEAGRFKVEYPAGRVLSESSARVNRIRISPDGRHVAITEHRVLQDDNGLVVILDRQGRRVAATREWASLDGIAWLPSGREVLFTASEQGADNSLRGLDLGGRVRQVHSNTGRLIVHDVAADGRVLLERATARTEMLYRKLGESEDRDLSWLDYSGAVAISPRGDTVLFYESGEGSGPEYSTYLRRCDGSPAVRVGPGRALDLSPDGSLALSVDIRNPAAIDLTPTGAGEIRKVRLPSLVAHEDAGFLADGRHIFVTGSDDSGRRRTWLTDIEGRDPRQLPLPEGTILQQTTFSRDGSRFVAECPDSSGPCSYDSVEGKPTPVPGAQKGWTAVAIDTRGRIYFRERKPGGPEKLLRVEGGRVTTLAELAPRDRAGAFGILDVSVAADGESWVYTFMRRLSELHVVTGIR